MYQRILVSIDDSVPAEKALAHALRLAKDQQASVCLVHVIEDRESRAVDVTILTALEVERIEGEWQAAGWAILNAAAERARAVGVQPELALRSKDGKPDAAHVIAGEAERWNADLIVLGTHGRRGLSRLFLGSVAQGVASMAPVPVLVVR